MKNLYNKKKYTCFGGILFNRPNQKKSLKTRKTQGKSKVKHEMRMRQVNPGWQIGFIMSSPRILVQTNPCHVWNSTHYPLRERRASFIFHILLLYSLFILSFFCYCCVVTFYYLIVYVIFNPTCFFYIFINFSS